ncbi:MAG: ABC transporter permease [Bradymonadaceae bacterium]|nr:ABC transporter permease [Lujinxingiaceae bacterium]
MIALVPQIGALVKNTLLETLRNKILYALFSFAVMAIGATSAFGALSLHQEERVFNNLVLFANVVFLAALAIYQGVGAIHGDISSRTIFTVLSKPVRRGTYIFGKYLGSFVTVALALVILLAFKVGVTLFLDYTVTPQLFAAYYGVLLQLAIVVALAIFFSTFCTQLLSALFTFSIFLVGSLTPQLAEASVAFAKTGNPVRYAIDVVLFVVPDLEKLNLSFELTHRLDVPVSYLLTATGYSAVYVAILLIGAYVVFRKRDFY